MKNIPMFFAVHANTVAQIYNLLYRRIAFGQASGPTKTFYRAHLLRIANPRYGRMEFCATFYRLAFGGRIRYLSRHDFFWLAAGDLLRVRPARFAGRRLASPAR